MKPILVCLLVAIAAVCFVLDAAPNFTTRWGMRSLGFFFAACAAFVALLPVP